MTPEAKVLKAIIGELGKMKRAGRRIFFFKIRGGATMMIAGLPDLCIVLEGRAIFVEVKRPGGKPTKLQEHRMQEIRNAAGVCGVVTSLEELRAMLDLSSKRPAACL